MAQFFFILGHQPALSLAELLAVWEKRGWKYSIETLEASFVIAEVNVSEDEVQKVMKVLGGTIKCGVGRKMSKITKDDALNELLKTKEKSGNKIYFGLSHYGSGNIEKALNMPDRVFALEIKRILKGRGYSARWVQGKEKALSAVIVAKNHLLDRGAELVVIDAGECFFLGRSLAVQEFEEFGRRDFGRPERDARAGMLPPKLARIMLNLAGVPTGGTILDPFCGAGTMLQEALMLGYERAWGSDISREAVEGAESNLRWLQGQTAGVRGEWQVKAGAVEDLTDIWGAGTVEGIVSEPYLGPTRGYLKISKIKKDLKELYEATLGQAQKVLKPGGVILWLWPQWQLKEGQPAEIGMIDWRALGFELEYILPVEWRRKLGAAETGRGNLIYSRPGQRVGREVVRLRKV